MTVMQDRFVAVVRLRRQLKARYLILTNVILRSMNLQARGI